MSEMRKLMLLVSALSAHGSLGALPDAIDPAGRPSRPAALSPAKKPQPAKNRAKVKAARKQRNKP